MIEVDTAIVEAFVAVARFGNGVVDGGRAEAVVDIRVDCPSAVGRLREDVVVGEPAGGRAANGERTAVRGPIEGITSLRSSWLSLRRSRLGDPDGKAIETRVDGPAARKAEEGAVGLPNRDYSPYCPSAPDLVAVTFSSPRGDVRHGAPELRDFVWSRRPPTLDPPPQVVKFD